MGKALIAGAGISGMTAAINLAHAGYDVTVLEKRSFVGSRFKGDLQGLENWTSKTNILDFLKKANIPTTFFHEPFKECLWYDGDHTEYPIRSTKAGFYLIRRGNYADCLDTHLFKTACSKGVTFQFNTPLKRHEQADIHAFGSREPFLIATGYNFKTDMRKAALAIFDNSVAPSGYAYLLGLNGYGTLATVSKVGTKNMEGSLKRALEQFRQLMDFKMEDMAQFGGVGTMYTPSLLSSDTIRTGEAATFQDVLWGFGLKMALQSGYLAAQAIINKTSYTGLVRKDLIPYCKASVINRFIYDHVVSRNYRLLLKRFSTAKDPVDFAHKMYRPSLFKHALFPLIRSLYNMKRRVAP